MSGDFAVQIGVMALTFGLALVPAFFSRRMERSDHLTLVAIPIATFFVAVLPGIIVWGFDKNSATYVLGAIIVVVVASLNYRFQPGPRGAGERAATGPAVVAAEAAREV
jgi:hypothetical protein